MPEWWTYFQGDDEEMIRGLAAVALDKPVAEVDDDDMCEKNLELWFDPRNYSVDLRMWKRLVAWLYSLKPSAADINARIMGQFGDVKDNDVVSNANPRSKNRSLAWASFAAAAVGKNFRPEIANANTLGSVR